MTTLTTYATAATTDSAAIHRIIKGMRELGWVAHRLNDGEVTRTVDSSESVGAIVADLTATDESHLYWTKDGVNRSMYFVLGNSPEEVMCDCSSDDGAFDADLGAVESAINLDGESKFV